MNDDELLTTRQVADLLKCTIQHVYSLVQKGILHEIILDKDGKRPRKLFFKKEVMQVVQQSMVC